MKGRNFFGEKFVDLPCNEAAEIEVSLGDIEEEVSTIRREIMPALKRLAPTEYGPLLDYLVELRVRIEHLTNHSDDLKEALQGLILAIEEKEKSVGTTSR